MTTDSRHPGGAPSRADRNGLALLVFAGVALGLYLVLMLVLTGLLESAADGLSRDRFWKIVLYWAVFVAPALPALWGAALVTVAAVRPFNRALLYYLATGLLMVGAIVFCLFLIAGGGGKGMVLALTVLATAAAAWLAMRRVLARERI